MIGYRISLKDLEGLIEKEKPGWLGRAKLRTKDFKHKGFYEEASSMWSEVKPVYMRLQGDSKCVYCERKLESIDLGKGEQDVEHFRPKGNVAAWKAPKSLADNGISFAAVAKQGGYFLLPYHPFNYSATCKPCNSALKKDYFPIAGKYALKGRDPKKLLTEKPYLVYPIGNFDNDPRALIRFHGTSPQPVAASGHKRDRALVTIEFFRLDDATKRKNLIRERAILIIGLLPQLEKLKSKAPAAEKKKAKDVVKGFTLPNSPHTNCAESFRELFDKDPVEAKDVFNRAVKFILSIS